MLSFSEPCPHGCNARRDGIDTDETDDGELMMAYARGDAAAFEQLYVRYKGSLYQYMMNSCGNEALARELYQDVWTRVVNARSQYTALKPFKAWLFRIARNRVIDHYRQQARVNETSFDPDEHSQSDWSEDTGTMAPDAVASLSQRAELLEKAMRNLPLNQREAILLRHIAGMSVNEVAAVVEEGAETVKSRLRYAVVKLRSQLQELS